MKVISSSYFVATLLISRRLLASAEDVHPCHNMLNRLHFYDQIRKLLYKVFNWNFVSIVV